MNKFLGGLCDGLSIAELAARVGCFTAGAICLLELARLAAKYAELIAFALRGPTSI